MMTRRRHFSLIAWLVISLSAGVVHAEQYETFVDIDNEEDLYDLLLAEQIGEDTFNTLFELHRRGVNLNTATRDDMYTLPNLTYREVDAILAYRDEAGGINDPAALVTNSVLSERKLKALASFLIIRKVDRADYAVDGWVRIPAVWTINDPRLPASAVQAHLATFGHLSLGLATVLTRNRISDVVFDASRGSLAAKSPTLQVHLAKLYAHWDTDNISAIIGTYRVGFGQRLTFDNTDQVTPNGIYADHTLFRSTNLKRSCTDSAGELANSPCENSRFDYVTPDYRWRDGLRGVAVAAKHLTLGPGQLQLVGFASLTTKSIYQYEIYDRAVCDDPRDDNDANCRAPLVFRRREDRLEPTSRFSFQTLPDMYNESVFGGNATYALNRRTHLGVTGYGAGINWLVDGMDLDFQEWARTPFGGSFGAVGADVAWGKDWADVFVEVARSFDSMPDGGGGLGAIVRTVATWGKSELEASARHYGEGFANPFARPIAAADEFDGLRARDETGGRLRYSGVLNKVFSLRTMADFWVQNSERAPKIRIFVRGDHEVSKQFGWGLWTEFQDKDLGESGRMNCFSVSTEFDENGEPVPCAGQKLSAAVRLRYKPRRDLSLSMQYQHKWLDDESSSFDTKYRQDISTWFVASAKVSDALRIRARLRFLFEDTTTNNRLEQSFWAYLDFTYRLPRDFRLKVRYDFFTWLDNRTSSLERSPNPAHWLWLEVEQKF